MAQLSPDSIAKLQTCDPQLRVLVQAVAGHWPCTVVFGSRTEADENIAIETGHSKLKNPDDSKHVICAARPFAKAVDLAPLPLDWKDENRFRVFAGYVLATADTLQIPLTWGGMWRSFPLLNGPGALQDLVHFEMKE